MIRPTLYICHELYDNPHVKIQFENGLPLACMQASTNEEVIGYFS